MNRLTELALATHAGLATHGTAHTRLATHTGLVHATGTAEATAHTGTAHTRLATHLAALSALGSTTALHVVVVVRVGGGRRGVATLRANTAGTAWALALVGLALALATEAWALGTLLLGLALASAGLVSTGLQARRGVTYVIAFLIASMIVVWFGLVVLE